MNVVWDLISSIVWAQMALSLVWDREKPEIPHTGREELTWAQNATQSPVWCKLNQFQYEAAHFFLVLVNCVLIYWCYCPHVHCENCITSSNCAVLLFPGNLRLRLRPEGAAEAKTETLQSTDPCSCLSHSGILHLTTMQHNGTLWKPQSYYWDHPFMLLC